MGRRLILKSAEDVLRAVLGPMPQQHMHAFHEPRVRIHPRALLERYGFWVQRCVMLNAQAAACVPYKLFSVRGKVLRGYRTKGAECKPPSAAMRAYLEGRTPLRPSAALLKNVRGRMEELTEIPSHPLLDLLDDINQWSDGYAFRESLYADLQIYGRSFTHNVNNQQLWRIPPHIVEVVPHPVNFVDFFKVGGEGVNRHDFKPAEVIWCRLYDPGDDWRGVGPLEAWIKTIDTSYSIQEFQKWLFDRGGSPDFVLKSKVLPDKKQRDAIRIEWRRLFGMLRRRKENLGFIGGQDAELVRLNQTNRELEFIESANMVRDHVGNAFSVPKSLLTSDDVNRTNARESDEFHMRTAVWPLVQRFEAVLNEQLVQPMFGEDLVVIHENPIPEDQTLVLARRTTMLQTGSTIDEVRAVDGQEPLGTPEAGEPLVMTGLSTLDQIINPPDPMAGFGGGFGGGGTSGSASGQGDDDAASGDDKDDEPPKDKAKDATKSHEAIWTSFYAGSTNGHDGCGHVEKAGRPRDRTPPALETDLDRFFRRQTQAVAELLEAGSLDDALALLKDKKWTRQMAEAIRGSIADVIDVGAAQGTARIGGAGSAVGFDVTNPRVQAHIDEYVIQLALKINGTTEHLLADLVGKELAAGASVPDLAAAIRKLDSSVSGPRAQMIARTETTRAFMVGQSEAWKDSGVVKGKQWLLAPGACEFCKAVAQEFAGKAIDVGTPFYTKGHVLNGVDGGTLRLNYTDIQGPPLHPHDRCDLLPVVSE